MSHLTSPCLPQVVAGDFHTLARSVTGHGYACGSSQWGQCGLGERTVRVSSLREITLLQEHGDIVAFAAGRRHTGLPLVSGFYLVHVV